MSTVNVLLGEGVSCICQGIREKERSHHLVKRSSYGRGDTNVFLEGEVKDTIISLTT